MQAIKLYQQLEKDFITPAMSDEWVQYMESVLDFLSDNFKKRSMGLVCDFTEEINKVYTAVFPSDKVMQRIISDNIKKTMLFVHHPKIWDIRQSPDVFQEMSRELLEQFKEKEISIYNLHVPLDNFGEYSTSVTLAKSLNIRIEKPFAPYFGALAGVIGKTDCLTVQDLQNKFAAIVSHDVSLYNYGDGKIENGKVAVVAGGGNDLGILKEMVEKEVKVLITGITARNDHSQAAHDFAEENGVNILGGTHYSTEKFACQAMVNYFEKQGLAAEFIAEEPVMEDL